MSRRLPYSGRYTVQLDAKNRAILPAPLRKLAEHELVEGGDATGGFYLTACSEGCLHLYTSVGFHRQLDLMRDNMDLIEDDAEYRQAELRFQEFLHDSVNLTLGEQGRMLIPTELVEKAGLSKGEPVLIVGSDTVIEVWSPAKYEDRFRPLRTEPETADTTLRKLMRRRPRAAAAESSPN